MAQERFNGKILIRIVVGVLLAGALLAYTNPTVLRHVAKLAPGPTPLDLMDLSNVPPEHRRFAERNHPATSEFVYKSYLFGSITRGKSDGGLTSVGLLGCVIDLR